MRHELAVVKLSILLSFVFVLITKIFILGFDDLTVLNIIKYIILFSVVFMLSIKRQPRWLHVSSMLIAVGLILYHWLDTCVYMAIHDRLTLNNMIANYSNLDVIPYFINFKITLFTVVVFALLIFLRNVNYQLSLTNGTISFFLYEILFITVIAFFILHSKNNEKYQGDAINLSNNFIVSSGVTDNTKAELNEKYAETAKRVDNYFNGDSWLKPSAHNMPNIVIVISESLSMVDSKYSGGLFDRTPQIDNVLKEGMVFKNAVSNGKITSHGLAGSLLGIQTTKTGGYKSMLTQFPPDQFPANNIINFAKSAGYKTIIISPGQPPSFFGMTEWFREVGFDQIYDIKSPLFAGIPRFTWNAPSDGATFEIAGKMISEQTQPFLMVIETVSLHQPYILPDMKYRVSDNDLINQVNYVDATTHDFYEQLKKTNFFKDGVFILYGDHRRFENLELEEVQSGGYAVWHERIICGIVGSKIKPNSVINIPYSLVDLNVLLHRLIETGDVDANMPMKANLGELFGTGMPFSVSLVDDDHGTYLIRSQNFPALYLSIYDMVPFDDISAKVYQEAAVYLILNDMQMKRKLTGDVK